MGGTGRARSPLASRTPRPPCDAVLRKSLLPQSSSDRPPGSRRRRWANGGGGARWVGRVRGRGSREEAAGSSIEVRQQLHQRVPLLHYHLALDHVTPREQVDQPLTLRLAQHGEEADVVGLRLEEHLDQPLPLLHRCTTRHRRHPTRLFHGADRRGAADGKTMQRIGMGLSSPVPWVVRPEQDRHRYELHTLTLQRVLAPLCAPCIPSPSGGD